MLVARLSLWLFIIIITDPFSIALLSAVQAMPTGQKSGMKEAKDWPPVGEEEDAGDGQGDLQVSPVTDEVGQKQEQELARTPEELDQDACPGSLGRAHHLHACNKICMPVTCL